MGFAHEYGLRQYRLRWVSYIFSRAKPTLRQSLEDIRKSSKKTPHILASHAVIPAQAGIQTPDFQKYSTITAVWTLPTDAVAEILVSAGRLCFTDETRHIFRRRF